MKKIFIFSFLLGSHQIFAADAPQKEYFFGGIKTAEDLLMVSLLGILIITCIVICFLAYSLQQKVQAFINPLKQTDEAYEQAMQNRTFWQKLASLKPLSMEKDLEMEHKYDDIAELDNPTPPWFMYLFYATIVFAVVYLIGFHIIGNGKIMVNEYSEEVSIAEKAREEYMKKFANAVNEDNVKALTDAKAIESGAKLYTQNCVACHGEKGEGKVGPNLTDEFWLHGGSDKNIFHTITEGVPEKGMISWKKTLNPIQVQQVLSFIVSLKGTNPPNPKEPQGDKYESSEASTDSTANKTTSAISLK
ncbi:cbb3-type cytochrome c oxidase N-terminal domain-containing protein [Arcicella lustrica]|uniref:Cbb3-type cytochrome c oxidase N-terminal domain-containing protein n=1 Tax=Arcicella lustrica TaxID=2984196 RepID=A0ABU5SFI2_9BACT|nr:cbb3-type cytochrome c oxidase N-terminal domain-containing protein [Arcicella sp. DC25W]MEA5426050.1 cbb3-type cytochrome c oxidase N-terminal domain-containing protein [Arcicella sp. DC25W]